MRVGEGSIAAADVWACASGGERSVGETWEREAGLLTGTGRRRNSRLITATKRTVQKGRSMLPKSERYRACCEQSGLHFILLLYAVIEVQK